MDSGLALDKLAPALVALQSEMTPVAKTASNPFFKSKYAPLPEVMEAAQPLLAKHKLAISQFVTHLDSQSALRTILLHESGQYLEDVQPLLLTKQDPQSQGSAITYARRYGVMAVLGLVADEDDDGNAASRGSAAPQSNAPKPVTEELIDQIYELAKAKGKDEAWFNTVVDKTKTSVDAYTVIQKLRALPDSPGDSDVPQTERVYR